MAVLFISEFTEASFQGVPNGLPVAAMPPVAEQVETITASSTQSNAFGVTTKIIRVHTDVVCSVAIGADPTATATTMRLPADHVEYFAVTPGQKIAVIENT